MHAEIIAIGDEITGGALLDTNSQWLSQRLAELGVRVLYHAAVGDDLDACRDVVRRAIDRSDIVIATGGLGPTADDLTREALAAAVRRPLVEFPEALEHIRGMFARRKREMPKSNERQAQFPEGSRMIQNPGGTAPGIDLDAPRSGGGYCRFFALPGVPAEMRDMWHGTLLAELRALVPGGRVIVRRNIKCFGAGESQVESTLPDLIRRGRVPQVGINASRATIILRIVAEGESEDACRAQIEPTVEEIRRCLGTLVYGEGDDELQDVVVRMLRERGKTVASAEIATGGQTAQWLQRASGGDGRYRGGLVAADESGMSRLLPSDESSTNERDSAYVRGLAIACREKFQTDFGLAVGAIPPIGDDGTAGHVHFALASESGERSLRISSGIHPDIVTDYLAKHAINLLRLELLGESST
jgi:nicotinamide-nucleotide amidase